MEDLKKEIQLLEQQLEEAKIKLKEEQELVKNYNPNWKPAVSGEVYWYKDSPYIIDSIDYNKTESFHAEIFENDLVFPTYEQALSYGKWYKAFILLVRIVAYANEKYKTHDGNYSFIINKQDRVNYNTTEYINHGLSLLTVKSVEGANFLLKNHPDLIRKVLSSPWQE